MVEPDLHGVPIDGLHYGLPLVFQDELDALLQPHVAPAKIEAGASMANIDSMIVQAQARFSALHPFSVGWDDDEPRIFVNMSPSDDPKNGEIRQVIFDAYTGKLLEVPKDSFDLTDFLLRLHSEMFLGISGEMTMGAMALTFVISLVSGALVYGPFMRRLDFGTYRRNGAKRTQWFDLHNLLGIVTLTWALVVGASGIMNALSTPLFDLWRAQTLPKIMAPYRDMPAFSRLSSINAAVDVVHEALPQMEITGVLFPNPKLGSPRHYIVWTRGKTPVTSRLFTPAIVDVTTGQITTARGLPWYLRALEVSRPLHFGDYGGLPLKIIWALFDVALIAVLLSGVYLWLSRRKTPVEDELDRLVKVEGLAAKETPAGALTR